MGTGNGTNDSQFIRDKKVELEMEKAKQQRIKADMMLLSVAIFWGASYLLVDYSLEELPVLSINALRFTISTIIIFLFFHKKLFPVNFKTLKYAALLGSLLVLTYLSSTFGVKYTSLSNVGFLCSLTVVFIPVLALLTKKQKAEKKLLTAVLFALVGIGLMTVNGGVGSMLGDFLCIMCALFYAMVLLVNESMVCDAEVNPFQLGVYQIAFGAIFQVILTIPSNSLRLPQSPKVWFSIVVLSVFCTGLAFVVQSVALQYTTASQAGIIFSLEPVFAALVAFFIAGEILSVRGYVGATLLMFSLFIMEIDTSGFKISLKHGRKKMIK